MELPILYMYLLKLQGFLEACSSLGLIVSCDLVEISWMHQLVLYPRASLVDYKGREEISIVNGSLESGKQTSTIYSY